MPIDSYEDLRTFVLTRLGEDPTDTTSDFYTMFDELFAETHRDIITRHPFLDLWADPPGVLVTNNDITTLTVTAASTGTSVAATLSAAPSGSISVSGYKLRPTGKSWAARITAHTAGSTTVTLDGVPETLAAGSACVLYQDEYTIASDLGVFATSGLWDQNGALVRVVALEDLLATFPDPPQGATQAVWVARVGPRKIRLSHYPTTIRRYEYPYVAEIADPSGSGALTLPRYLRTAYAEGTLALVMQQKFDRRQAEAQTRYEQAIEKAIIYERRRRLGVGTRAGQTAQGGYRDVARYGRA